MTQLVYPFDPLGTNEGCHIVNEQHALPALLGRYRCFIPSAAPFYVKDFVIKQGAQVLKEGTDFYFGHQYLRGTHQTAQMMYGSIQIVNKALTGPFTYSYRSLGGQYTLTDSAIVTFLNSKVQLPTVATWEQAMGVDKYFPPVDIQYDINDWHGESELITSLGGLATDIVNQDPTKSDMFDNYDRWLDEQQLVVDESAWAAHLANLSNPHKVKWYQAGALKSDGIAQNAALFTGKTLDVLTTYINAQQGVSASLPGLFPLVGDRTITGDLILQDGRANFSRYSTTTKENKSFLQLGTGNQMINGERSVTIRADYDMVSPGEYAQLVAGPNVLKVVSSGAIQEPDKLLYNNQQVLTTETLASHLPTDANADVDVRYVNSGAMVLSGKGSTGSPLKATFTFPAGGTSQRGLIRLTSTVNGLPAGAAATPKAIKTLRDRLADLVPTSRKINGKALTANITITTTNLGLNLVDNIADANLVVNANHTELLELYSLTTHSHPASDFSMNNATTAVAGLVQYSNTIEADNSLALTSAAASTLQGQSESNDKAVYNKFPTSGLDLVQYGDNSYLPVPVVGTYPAAGVQPASLDTVGEVEADGKLVLLRNGADFVSQGVFYSYAILAADNSISKLVSTTTLYQPEFLQANETASYVYRGTEGAFLLKGTTHTYVVLTNGTMDSKYHDAAYFDPTGIPLGHQVIPSIVGDYVYLTYCELNNTQYSVRAWRCSLSAIRAGGLVTFAPVLLSGTDAYGNVITNQAVFEVAPVGLSTVATDQPAALNSSAGYWTGINIRQAAYNFDSAVSGDKLRIMSFAQIYLTNAFTAKGQSWLSSYVVDFATNTVTVDNPGMYPIEITAAGAVLDAVRTGVDGAIAFPGAAPNNTAGVIRSRGLQFSYRYYGIELIPVLFAFKTTDAGATIFDSLHCQTRAIATMNNVNYKGNYGSACMQNAKTIHFIGGNRIVGTQADGTAFQAEYDPNTKYLPTDTGYGPTINRKLISTSALANYTRTIHVYDGVTASNRGTILADGNLSNASVITGEVLSATISVTAANFTLLKDTLKSALGTIVSEGRFINDTLNIYVSANAEVPVVGVYMYRYYTDATLTTQIVTMQTVRLSTTARLGDIGAVSYVSTIATRTATTSATSLNVTNYQYGGSTFAKLSDGNWFLALQTNSYAGWIGNGGAHGNVLAYYPATDTFEFITAITMYTYQANGYYYTPELGIIGISRHSSGEAVLAAKRGNTIAAFKAGGAVSTYLHSSRVAEGWYVYLTEPMTYYISGTAYTLPVTALDVRTFFPGDYQNRTLYIYAMLSGGVVSYTMSGSKTADTDYSTYIGYCKTDSTKLTELVIEKATRLGYFRELQDHINEPGAHGMATGTKDSVGLSLVANKATRYELKTGLFGEVFNSWTRFSHWPTDYSSAAYPAEVNAWSYDAASDSVACTMNTTGYSGFVSTETVGDYTFDTVVGVKPASADRDNDAITLIIGFVTVGGVQHDISVVRSCSVEAHIKVSSMFGIYYDYMLPDQKLIAMVDTTTAGEVLTNSWWSRWARMRVVRTGDSFSVKSTLTALNNDWSSAVDTDFVFSLNFTLNDLPELAKFKGPTRYGYGAVSQTTATYVNYLRPDEDGRNYYASAIEAIRALYWQDRMTILSGLITSGDTLPIPAGYQASECRYFLQYEKTAGYGAGNGILGFSLSEANRVVTSYNPRVGPITGAAITAYTVVAVKGFKLFK